MKRIKPSTWVNDIFQIDYRSLWNDGYRLIVFDLDHTLLSIKSYRLSVKTRRRLRQIKKMGFQIAFLSNTGIPYRERRVREVVSSVKFSVISVCCNYFRCKPRVWGFQKVCHLAGISAEKAVMVGDMLLRDIIGAQNAGYGYTILVEPYGPDHVFLLRCRRQERKIIEWLKEHGLYPD